MLCVIYKLIVAHVPWLLLFKMINCGCVNAVILCLCLGHQKDLAASQAVNKYANKQKGLTSLESQSKISTKFGCLCVLHRAEGDKSSLRKVSPQRWPSMGASANSSVEHAERDVC